MSTQIKETKRRILSVRQLRHVATAMQKVATARLNTGKQALARSTSYTGALLEIAGALEQYYGKNPAAEDTGTSPCFIIFGSERGLCGSFNSDIADHLASYISANSITRAEAIVVGKTMSRKIKRVSGLVVSRIIPQPTLHDIDAMIEPLCEELLHKFYSGSVSGIYLVFSRFVNGSLQTPVSARLLPFETAGFAATFPQPETVFQPASVRGRFIFEPSPHEIISEMIPEIARQLTAEAFINSVCSENASRQTAMGRAAENAGAMLSDLMKTYRRMRQESITNDMMELVTGSLS